MKKTALFLALSAFATTAFAQTTPSTEIKVRDNGTTKVVTKTGKTNVGQALDNTKDAAENVAHRTGSAIERGAKRTDHAVKHEAKKLSTKAKKGTAEMESKTE